MVDFTLFINAYEKRDPITILLWGLFEVIKMEDETIFD